MGLYFPKESRNAAEEEQRQGGVKNISLKICSNEKVRRKKNIDYSLFKNVPKLNCNIITFIAINKLTGERKGGEKSNCRSL